MPVWLLLALAIGFEVLGTVFLRYSDGFTKLLPVAVVVIGYGISFYLLALILKTGIPQGIVYAIWSAFGIALVTLAGMWFFGDKISMVTGIGLAVVIAGVLLVQLGNKAVTH
ncbi:MAG: multidrug efflux SMR transporter [Actinomycetes bacterium]